VGISFSVPRDDALFDDREAPVIKANQFRGNFGTEPPAIAGNSVDA